ncbi:MAG TPA: dynamin family protein [Kofleriaceae bacterium]|nr:dynamin family protein [Kofleriaceae bacterium]
MTFLAHHKAIKHEIVARLERLAELADGVGMVTLARDIRTSRIPKLEAERFHLVVLGEFNHGKSSFVNALLGADVLPTGITPTTSSLNHVVWGPSASARVVLQSGESRLLEPSQLKDWVTVAGGRSAEVAYVELAYPSELLRNNVVLVDTPGVNDLNEQRAEITYGYVPRADAVVFLLDAGQALKDSEREFLRSRVLEAARDRLIFVLGKMDLLNAEERTAVVEYVQKGLGQLVQNPVMFPLSARDWARGHDPQSGMPELMRYLERFLSRDRAQVILDNAAADAARTAGYLENNLGVRLTAYSLDLGELELRIGQVREQLDSSKRKLDELHVRIDADAQSIKNQVALDLESFTRAFVAAIPSQIEAVDADDVKAHLPAFIEDKFREWAELEGAKLAAMMEHLAEEVITITNENVAAAASTLAERLTPEDTRVEITVDSFKYDVGIYAVGALGTTVMLFVNALAGGLLTLAAPILAIVLKSKVSGDIREQAKVKVPAAIMHAAEAMRPHFDKCIDDFARRLTEFVSNAGNTLYKGISEILDRTMKDRKERGGEVDAMRADTSAQIQQVVAARAAIGGLRERIWAPDEEDQEDKEDQPRDASDDASDGARPAPDANDDAPATSTSGVVAAPVTEGTSDPHIN